MAEVENWEDGEEEQAEQEKGTHQSEWKRLRGQKTRTGREALGFNIGESS